jgi:glycosyltransferase involved in cell wall biosynthesis
MDPIDPSAQPISEPTFQSIRPRCIAPILKESGVVREQVFFTPDISSTRGLFEHSRKIDLVICHGMFVAATPALIAFARMLRKPFVGQTFLRPLKYELRRSPLIHRIRRCYFRKCTAIIAAGDPAILWHYGIHPDKVHLFNPFIDVASQPVESTPLRSPGDAIKIGFVGQLFHLKGLPELLEAYERLLDRHPSIELWLIGGTPAEAANVSCEALLRQRVAARNLKGVHITGWLPRQDVVRLLGNMDIFAFPSRGDTYPKAVMEAMAAGLPVVISDACGSVGSLAVHEETALVFEAGNVEALAAALNRLIESPAARADLGQAAKQAIVKHTKQAVCAVYDEVIGSLQRHM